MWLTAGHEFGKRGPIRSARVASFFEEQQRHLARNGATPQFSTFVPLVDELYEAAFAARPVPIERVVFQLLLLCHRAFLIAVCVIARGHPDDDAGITRRALEMAKVAFAATGEAERQPDSAA